MAMSKYTVRVTAVEKVTGKQKSVRVPGYILNFWAEYHARLDHVDIVTYRDLAKRKAKYFLSDHIENNWDQDPSDYICTWLLKECMPPDHDE